MQNDIPKSEEDILKDFNRRDVCAFGLVYNLYYTELTYFARQVYRGTEVNANDVVHDILIKIWKTEKLVFEALLNIKAYIIISIKNSFLDYIKHKKQIHKFEKIIIGDPDNFVSQIIEAETLTLTSEMMKILPQEMAKVFKLYIEGWDMKEIALKLGKKESTVYSQKRDAISFLKKRITEDQFLILHLLFGI